MKRRILTCILAVLLFLSCVPVVSASHITEKKVCRKECRNVRIQKGREAETIENRSGRSGTQKAVRGAQMIKGAAKAGLLR